MNTKLFALAAALAASLSLASTAQAGGGVRLGFGGPLGTFVATPSNGGGGGSSYQQATPQKRMPVKQAARPEKSAPRVANVPNVANAKSVAKTETSAVPVSKTDSAPDGSNRVTGSSALIQGSIPAEEPATEKATPTTEIKAEAPAASDTMTAAAPVEQPRETAPAKTPDTAETCKKFIPAIGTTISVGCPD